MKNVNIVTSVNGRTEFATVKVDREGSFELFGGWHHVSDLQEFDAFGGGTGLFLPEWNIWHPDGVACDVRGCCGN